MKNWKLDEMEWSTHYDIFSFFSSQTWKKRDNCVCNIYLGIFVWIISKSINYEVYNSM